MKNQFSRRRFLKHTSTAAAGLWFIGGASSFGAKKLSPNEKLNIGVVGTGNRARADLQGVSSENIVALCDIDSNFLAAAKKDHPNAKTYSDFRKMLEQKDIDAVVIGTADHTHAVACVA